MTQQAIQKVKEKSKFRLDAARLLGVDGSVRLRRWRRESNPCGEYQEKWQLVCYSRPKVREQTKRRVFRRLLCSNIYALICAYY